MLPASPASRVCDQALDAAEVLDGGEATRAPAPVTTITSWAASTARGTDLDQAGQRSRGR